MTQITPEYAYARFQYLVAVHAVDSVARLCAGLAKAQKLPIERSATELVSNTALTNRIKAPAEWLNGMADVLQTAATWLLDPSRADQPLTSFLTASYIPWSGHGLKQDVPPMKARAYADQFLKTPAQELMQLGTALVHFKTPAAG